MKSLKFIPVLAVAALLSACGTSKSVSVKAPKLLNKGKEVQLQEFVDGANEALSGLETLKAETVFGSKTMNSTSSWEEKESLKRDGKLYGESREAGVQKASVKADAKNYVMSAEISANSERSVKLSYGGQTRYVSHKQKSMLQEIEVEGEKYMGQVNVTEEAYSVLSKITDENPMSELFNQMMSSAITSGAKLSFAQNFLAMASTLSDEELENYKFYVNGNVYTVEYKTEDASEILNSSDEVVANEVDSLTSIYQFKLDDKDLKTTSLEEYKETKTYVADYDEFYEGDVYVSEENEYTQFECKDAKVSLKPVSYEGYKDMGSLI